MQSTTTLTLTAASITTPTSTETSKSEAISRQSYIIQTQKHLVTRVSNYKKNMSQIRIQHTHAHISSQNEAQKDDKTPSC